MRKLKIILLLEGILSIGLAALMFFIVGIRNGLYLLSVPFELIGIGLRYLSLNSSIGNGIAIFLYVAFSLLPVLYMIVNWKRPHFKKVDFLLPIISFYSFYMMYEFINPRLMINRIPTMMADVSELPLIKLSFAIIFYSLCIGYLILRLVGTLSTLNIENKYNAFCMVLQKILIFLSALYTFFLGYFYTFELFASLRKNIKEDRSSINAIFLIIKFICECLPIVFTILILVTGVLLLNEMISNHLKEEEINAAFQMSIISKRTVYVTVICNLALNILQFLLSNQLNDTYYNLEISLFPLIIAFSAMILSGYFRQSKELYEDNEMII